MRVLPLLDHMWHPCGLEILYKLDPCHNCFRGGVFAQMQFKLHSRGEGLPRGNIARALTEAWKPGLQEDTIVQPAVQKLSTVGNSAIFADESDTISLMFIPGLSRPSCQWRLHKLMTVGRRIVDAYV